MKRTIIGLICFIGTNLPIQAQAPQSLSGFTMYANFQEHNPFGSNGQDVIDFFSNGAFSLRLSTSQNILPPSRNGYQAQATGTYQYQVTSPTTGVLNLNPAVFGNISLMTFSSDSKGTISFSSNPILSDTRVLFYLAPTGGTPSQRAVINLSMLVSAKRGTPTIIGFVIGGTADYREVLIRAVGPSLAQFGVPGSAPNPTYSFAPAPWVPNYASSWSATTASVATIASEGMRAGAFPLNQGSNDKADIFLLSPGSYTITVNPTTSDQEGAELIEVYEISGVP